MGLNRILPEGLQEVDIIVAGGGTTGCIVASRLAEADPQLSILVIENGQDNYNHPQVIHPGLLLANLKPDSLTCVHHKSNKEEQLMGREVIATVGSVLGGSSSINGLLYVRGQQSDYDAWNMPGWSSTDILPYLKKFETYHGIGDREFHGHDGPIEVSTELYCGEGLGQEFVTAMTEIGCPEVKDLQDLQTAHGAAKSFAYVSPKDGRRQDVAHKYLHPLLQDGKHPNLHVLVESQVLRVFFDDNQRATGVEFRPNPRFQIGSNQGPVQTIKAKRLVVLTAGALGTPPILERSGVGDPEVLGRAGIQTTHALPGVGRNYEDHQLLTSHYKCSISPSSTIDCVFNGVRNTSKLVADGDEILKWNGFDAFSKHRPTESELESLGVDFQKTWKQDFQNSLDRPLVGMALYTGILGDRGDLPAEAYFTLCTFPAYPYSRGHVHVTGAGMDDPLDFVPGYLSDPNDFDLKTHVWSYKKQREAARRMPSYRGEVASHHPQFPQGSKASCDTGALDGNSRAKGDIEYSPEDDEAIEKWARESVGVCWHFLGTCRMAPKEQMGVVDETLSVHCLEGLKVADMSIAPKMVSANTYSTSLMVGEKAAAIFLEELGLGVAQD